MSQLSTETFYIDSIPDLLFAGYSNGDTWNGFACPLFEKSIAERILQASTPNGYIWAYDAENDVYTVRHIQDHEDYEPERFEGQQVFLDGHEIILYPIGAYSWIWSIQVNGI